MFDEKIREVFVAIRRPRNADRWTMADEKLNARMAQLWEQTFQENGPSSSPNVKIQKIPPFLRQNTNFFQYCLPKMISFGPIHYRRKNLKLGQEFKILWASFYIQNLEKKQGFSKEHTFKKLHEKVENDIGLLRNLFSEDVTRSYDDEELTWMLLVDGCALLYYINNVDDQNPNVLRLKLDQLMYTWRDILLLENQLPLRLLELLVLRDDVAHLENILYNFIFMGLAKRDPFTIRVNRAKAIHLLDYIRSFHTSTICNDDDDDITPFPKEGESWERYKNIRDLIKAGIKVKPNETNKWEWNKISFTSYWFSGELRLPVMVVNDATPYFFHNLIAYEMSPDFPNNFEFCSYFSMMDSLIDDAEDVKELRLAGVLRNLLGSDEEVAKLFNELGHELPAKMFNYMVRTDLVAYSKEYIKVKHQINKHYGNKWKTWLAQARNTYFNTPWSLIAFLAAVLALALTSIQTWYAIHPKS
ncbi:hypothetical protein AHAS_Ahas15G0166500 [Arachis hypogaea]